jgi:hypothetical protein
MIQNTPDNPNDRISANNPVNACAVYVNSGRIRWRPGPEVDGLGGAAAG